MRPAFRIQDEAGSVAGIYNTKEFLTGEGRDRAGISTAQEMGRWARTVIPKAVPRAPSHHCCCANVRNILLPAFSYLP